MSRTIVSTPDAPAAIGTYSQAVKVGNTVYLSGQIGLDPVKMDMVDGIDAQIARHPPELPLWHAQVARFPDQIGAHQTGDDVADHRHQPVTATCASDSCDQANRE